MRCIICGGSESFVKLTKIEVDDKIISVCVECKNPEVISNLIDEGKFEGEKLIIVSKLYNILRKNA